MPAGNLVWVPPGALVAGDKIGASFHTMAAWSRTSDRLYYRDAAGVHSWDPPATVGTLAEGLIWYSLSVSPDGRYVAYTVSPDTGPPWRCVTSSRIRCESYWERGRRRSSSRAPHL